MSPKITVKILKKLAENHFFFFQYSTILFKHRRPQYNRVIFKKIFEGASCQIYVKFHIFSENLLRIYQIKVKNRINYKFQSFKKSSLVNFCTALKLPSKTLKS